MAGALASQQRRGGAGRPKQARRVSRRGQARRPAAPRQRTAPTCSGRSLICQLRPQQLGGPLLLLEAPLQLLVPGRHGNQGGGRRVGVRGMRVGGRTLRLPNLCNRPHRQRPHARQLVPSQPCNPQTHWHPPMLCATPCWLAPSQHGWGAVHLPFPLMIPRPQAHSHLNTAQHSALGFGSTQRTWPTGPPPAR